MNKYSVLNVDAVNKDAANCTSAQQAYFTVILF